MKKIDKDFFSACSLTFVSIVILLQNINSKSNDAIEIVLMLCLIAIVGCAIAQWVKCVKVYIDRRIEDKLNEKQIRRLRGNDRIGRRM